MSAALAADRRGRVFTLPPRPRRTVQIPYHPHWEPVYGIAAPGDPWYFLRPKGEMPIGVVEVRGSEAFDSVCWIPGGFDERRD